MTNAEIIDLWLDVLAAVRGTAASSLKTCHRDVACYPGWQSKRRLADVTRHDMVAYLAHVDERALSHSTISRRRSVAHGIHRCVVAEGLGTSNAAAELQPMRRPERLPFTPGVQAVAPCNLCQGCPAAKIFRPSDFLTRFPHTRLFARLSRHARQLRTTPQDGWRRSFFVQLRWSSSGLLGVASGPRASARKRTLPSRAKLRLPLGSRHGGAGDCARSGLRTGVRGYGCDYTRDV